jgi:hypothetical protein
VSRRQFRLLSDYRRAGLKPAWWRPGRAEGKRRRRCVPNPALLLLQLRLCCCVAPSGTLHLPWQIVLQMGAPKP